MPIYKRQDIPKLLAEFDQGSTSQIYLIWGERYLCRNAAQELIDRLLPEEKSRTTGLQLVDGDQEDFSKTLNQLKTFSLFSGPQVILVTDSKLFHSKGVAKNVWDKACENKERNENKQAIRYLMQMFDLAGISFGDPDNDDIASLSAARWKNLFGFNKPQDNLSWIGELLADIPPDLSAGKHGDKDAASQYVQAYENGIPRNNTLILLAETVDKRKRFYKYIQEHGVIFDLAVESGGSTAAKKDQEKVIKELILKKIAEQGKELAPDTLPVLLERIGFHPVAAVMEAEKLALYAGERKTITRDDIEAIIGRTREEALYELTEAVTAGNLENGLLILAHLHDNGVHGLAILATLRNHLKKLLLVRSFQELGSPSYSQSLPYQVFQKRYLPQLQEGREEWSTLLWKNHPYGLYMLFRQAARFSLEYLQKGLKAVLAAEYRMKSSSVDSRLVMDNLLFSLMLRESAEEVSL